MASTVTSAPHAHAHTHEKTKASLYRMVMPKHTCPWGLKTKWLLEREGYEVQDFPLTTAEETEAFKAEHGVSTTPQTFISGVRIGGYEDVRKFLGKEVQSKDETSYQPVMAVFGVAAAAAFALSLGTATGFGLVTLERFVALSMAMLAMLKLQDVRSFSTMFLNYDLLAQRWVPYGFVYPFAEAAAAVMMLSPYLAPIAAPIALVIGTIGAVSVINAVYIQRRELKCACVGGSSNVPLGFVSLTENLAMIAMGLWTLYKLFL